MPKLYRINAIEGLRAYLAFWVVFAHLLQSSGYVGSQGLKVLTLLGHGGYSVDLFMIISGFVIALLIDTKNERYIPYLARRFFRLFPLSFSLFLIAILLTPLFVYTITNYEHMNSALLNRVNLWNDFMWENILLHATMLHGVIPHQTIPFAPVAYLQPAWSVSTEWQFYIIAPFVIRLLSHRNHFARSLCIVIIIVTCLLYPYYPYVHLDAFFPQHAPFFYIGIVSYFAYTRSEISLPWDKLTAAALPLCFVIYLIRDMSDTVLPILMWVPFFFYLLSIRDNKFNMATIVFKHLFENKAAAYLGKISFSIYLSHPILIIVSQWAIIHMIPGINNKVIMLLLLMVTVIPTTILISMATYYLIELPGMKFGKYVSTKFQSSNP